MQHNSIPVDFSVEIIDVTPYNPLISKCQIKVCWVGEEPNRNGSIITKEVARDMAKTIPGSPIVGYFNEDSQDFEEHNRAIEFVDGEIKFKDTTRPYGFVDLNAKVWFQKFIDDEEFEREYLVTEGWIWTGQYPESKRVVDEGNNQSMELDEKTLDATWTKTNNENQKFFIINEAIIKKLCILGEDYEPCFEGASITAPVINFSLDENFKNQIFSMIKEMQEYLKEGGINQVFEKYPITIGDSTWCALYAAVNTNDYRIDGTYESEGQTFAVVQNLSDMKYYRLNFNKTVENDESVTHEIDTEDSYTVIEKYEEETQFAQNDVENWLNSQDKVDEEVSEENQDFTEEKTVVVVEAEESTENEEKAETEVEVIVTVENDPVFVELQTKYDDLTNKFTELQNKFNDLLNQNKELASFKAKIDKKQKEDLIKSFYMLDDSDKADVNEHIDEYSLEEIESKLSVIGFRKRINFSLDDEDEEQKENKENIITTYNVSEGEDNSTPAWVKKATEIAKQMKD